MIRTQDEFDETLQSVMELLDRPPAPGTPEDERFSLMMEELRSFEPASEDLHQVSAVQRSLDDLEVRLAQARKAQEHQPPDGSFSGFRFGGDLDPH